LEIHLSFSSKKKLKIIYEGKTSYSNQNAIHLNSTWITVQPYNSIDLNLVTFFKPEKLEESIKLDYKDCEEGKIY
jgi:hypothetical protein